ncbi:DUF1289 domain-containing protein [Shewanella woodyi]|uniref:DUF1289 domain-containing protein n=1 Tax=Shewanella woodyi (strain ATCC 51908 / MS32) TaxID=392500 RepID=B1KMQ5_SHEWM|nr:DUF1289 domain-containing protein [Shewanella woodyi]ACA87433.1 protein of unknown function DUF1289 [Shewanella woodyi ATCC 51908]
MIQSPCVAKCGVNEDDICMGCYRNIDEIVGWSKADNAFKAEVWKQIPARKAALGKGENSQKISRDKWQEVAARLESDTAEA